MVIQFLKKLVNYRFCLFSSQKYNIPGSPQTKPSQKVPGLTLATNAYLPARDGGGWAVRAEALRSSRLYPVNYKFAPLGARNSVALHRPSCAAPLAGATNLTGGLPTAGHQPQFF
jgi:hypothetical protein